MLNNLENKVENLNSVMKKLTANELATKTDLNIAFNELAKSLESISTMSNEQFAKKFMDSFRYLLEEKNRNLQSALSDFEEYIKPLKESNLEKSFNDEINRISGVVTSIFGKFDEQEQIFLNLSRSLESVLKKNDKNEIDNLRTDFSAFSQNLNEITGTINKNFNFFLAEVQKLNTRNEVVAMGDEIQALSRSANSIMSSIDIIDHKYQDMKSIVDLITGNESTMSLVLEEFKQTSQSLEGILPRLRKNSTTEDVQALGDKVNFIASFLGNLREFVETSANLNIKQMNDYSVSLENKIMALSSDDNLSKFEDIVKNINDRMQEILDLAKEDMTRGIATRLTYFDDKNNERLQNEFGALKDNLRKLSSEIVGLDNTLSQNITIESRKIKDDVSNIDSKITDNFASFKTFLDNNVSAKLSEIEDSAQNLNQENYAKINEILTENLKNFEILFNEKTRSTRNETDENVIALKKEVKAILLSLIALKDDFDKAHAPNALKETIEQAILKIDESPTGRELTHLGEELNRVSQKLNGIFGAIEENFDKLETSSSVEILQKINEIIPILANNLDNFKEKVKDDNQTVLRETKKYFNDVTDTLKANVDALSSNIKSDNKDNVRQATQELRQDLQTLSNNLTESFENINSGIIREFAENKEKIEALSSLIAQTENQIEQKVDGFKSFVESNSYEVKESLQEAITASVVKYTEHLNNVATDILTKITAMDDFSNSTFSEIEKRIDELLKSVTESQTLALEDEFSNFNAKLDKITQSQSNTSKDVLSEIGTLASLHNDENVAVKSLLQKIDNQFNSKNDLPAVISEYLDNLQKDIVQQVKDEFFKQAQSFSTGFTRIVNSNKATDANFTDLNNQIDLGTKNVIQEFRNEFQKQYQMLVAGFAKLKTEDKDDFDKENVLKDEISALSNNLTREFKSELQLKIEGLIEDFTHALAANKNDSAIELIKDKLELIQKSLNQEFKLELVNLASELQDEAKNNNINLNNIAERINAVTENVAQKFKDELQDYKIAIVDSFEKIEKAQNDNFNAIFDIKNKIDDLSNSISRDLKFQLKEIADSLNSSDELRSLGEKLNLVSQGISDELRLNFKLISENFQDFNNIDIKLNEIYTGITNNFKNQMQEIFTAIKTSADFSKIENTLDDIKENFETTFNASLTDILARTDVRGFLEKINEKIDGILDKDSKQDIERLNGKLDVVISKDNTQEFERIDNKLDKVLDKDNSQDFERIDNKLDNLSRDNSQEFGDLKEKIIEAINRDNSQDFDEIHGKLDDILAKDNTQELEKIDDKLNTVLNKDNSQDFEKINNKLDEILIQDSTDTLKRIDGKLDNALNQDEVIDKLNSIDEKIDGAINFDETASKLDRIDEKIDKLKNDETASAISNLSDKIDETHAKIKNNALEVIDTLKNEFRDSTNEIINLKEDLKGTNSSIKEKIDVFVDGLASSLDTEFKKQTDLLNSAIDKIDDLGADLNSQELLGEIHAKLLEIQTDETQARATYNFHSVAKDFDDVKNLISQNNVDDLYKNINALKALTSNNSKLSEQLEEQISYVNNWLRGAAEAMEILAHKVDKIEKMSFDGSEKTLNINTERFDTIALNLLKKFKSQEAHLDSLEDKMQALIQKPAESTDMSAFIKIFHDNVTYTKGLASRIEVMESQMSNLQKSMEQIISYIEE